MVLPEKPLPGKSIPRACAMLAQKNEEISVVYKAADISISKVLHYVGILVQIDA